MTGTGGPPPPRPSADPTPDLSPAGQLRLLMRAWRERLDLLAGPATPAGPGRARVTQHDLATLLDVSPTWYRNLERGVPSNYGDAFLTNVADVLHLDPDERDVLFRLAAGHPPPQQTPAPATVITDSLDEIVHAQPWPTYIVDAAWDVHVHNHAMDRWFPQLRRVANIMRLAFCIPDTSRQLLDFEHDWAPSMIGQMRGALARWPTNTRLTELITDVLAANPHARHLWQEPVVRTHADGERRRLYLPHTRQPRHVEVVALALMRAEHLRMIMLKPIRDHPTCRSTPAQQPP